MDNTFNENEFPVDMTGTPSDTGSAAPERPGNTAEPVMSWNPHPPQQEPPVQPSTYSGTGAGHRESPYADSPYVMHHHQEQRQQYAYQPPVPPQPAPQRKKPRKPGAAKRITAAVLALVLLCGVCGGFAWLFLGMRDSNAALIQQIGLLESRIAELEASQTTPTLPSGASPRPSDGSTLSPSQLYSACVNSVVAISSTFTSQGYYGTSEGSSSGSGFILSAEGYIVTNAHVVEDASSVHVILHDKSMYAAKVVGLDSANDIAVLKLLEDVPGLQAAALGSSSQLAIGDMVAAIGNPLGELASTQTIGYVSGINREVTTDNTIISMLQTDAAINPGNSGGPLFNMYGEVIGITTAKYSGTTGSGASIEGIGFAIPIDDVKSILSDLIDYGYVTGAYLGVTVRDIDSSVASIYGLPSGAYVDTVVEGISAHRAGVKPKDIIIALGEHEVTSVASLTRALRNFKAGNTTTITVLRSGQELTLEITLDEKPRDTSTTAPEPQPTVPSGSNTDKWPEYFPWPFG